ncbi:hypothetical protein Salat_2116400 [Sesamum alatum]|uniref:Uncharacterized protein n=1 Tax=Sesamum alatum TaxID=300844 RepID=A0AAE1Y0U2_9LAMI|nr:hypothetical protein Salat_2116400 [Sesamum alatum]
MVVNGSKAGVSTAPPHELNVRKFAESRASELKGLHSLIAERLDNNFRSQRNKRRRTTGHDDRVAKKKFRKRRRVGAEDMGKIDSVDKDEKKNSRRVRRNVELKKNPLSGFGTSGDGTKRLRTHVWHAKRFTMTKLWGFHIPVGLHGRGRGSRALMKKLKHGVLVHDASYYGCVQFEGPEDMLVSVLSAVLVPSPSTCSEGVSHDILAGTIFGTAMLHHAGKPSFPPVSPVTYMWRPVQQISTNTGDVSIDNFHGEQNMDDSTIIRQVWVWIHAAAFKEAYDALSSSLQRQTDRAQSARVVTREGQLAKLELMGSKVFQLLQKTLLPASGSENSWHLKTCSADEHDDFGESEKTSISQNSQISSSAVVSLVVKDPRALTKKGTVIVRGQKPLGLLSNGECQIEEQTVSSCPKNEAECACEYNDLWDTSKGVCPPVEESFLSTEKYHQHKEFICLGHKSSESQNASVDGEYSRLCPILLLKNENHEDSITRCSIILPLSWVKAFWLTFMSNGAHAIGLREKHWVACELGLPHFPADFPDCDAYSNVVAMEAAALRQKSRLLPPSKRPLEVPIAPPWDCVRLTSGKRSSEVGNSGSQVEELGTQDEKIDMSKSSSYEKMETSSTDCHGVPFEGNIARTSSMLNNFLNNISGDHFLLFPKIRDQRSCLYKLMKDEAFLKPDTTVSEVQCGKTQCYIRVLLRAYKEGVFEQGAVVCAPDVADIMLWKARSQSDNQQLQIPQSSLKSYFLQLPSGKWELQIPEDPTRGETYRWPIGFITTGFVRGSKRATASALCDASLLSGLRKEQWKALPVRQRRKEIYVLVRNLRSTAYRLALATIVLEQQEQDVKFM